MAGQGNPLCRFCSSAAICDLMQHFSSRSAIGAIMCVCVCTSTAQVRRIWVAAASASSDCALVVVPRAFSDMAIAFRGRRRSKVDFS